MDAHVQTFRIENHQLAYLAFNPQDTRQPIILLHGLTSSIGFWHKGAPYTQYGPCYALSLPGHYPAVFPQDFQSEHLSVKELGRLVAEGIQHLVPDRPVTVIGHSTGGLAGLAAAIHAPTKINRLITIAGFVSGQRTGSFGFLERLAQTNSLGRLLFPLGFAYRFHPALLRLAMGSFVADRQAITSRPTFNAELNATYTYMRHLHIGSMWAYFRMLPQMDLAYRLPKIAAATLAIAGDKDPIVPPEQSQIIASRVPNSKLALIPGAGHLPMVERPQRYEQHIHEWLGR